MENKFQPVGVILADCPWQYEVWSEKGKGRSAENHYKTLMSEHLFTLQVNKLAAKDCALLMWATWPTLETALILGQRWGFTYKTCGFLWAKTNRNVIGRMIADIFDPHHWFMGNGHYTRANTEPVLLFTRGHPKRKSKSVRQLVVMPIQVYDAGPKQGQKQHSKKPLEVHRRIERLFDGPYLELFARQSLPGWTCLGNEIDGLDMTEAISRLLAPVLTYCPAQEHR